MGTRGFQEEARSTATELEMVYGILEFNVPLDTELERCRQERSQENGHQLGRG